MVYSQGIAVVGVHVETLLVVAGVGVQLAGLPNGTQLRSVTVPAAKLLVCWLAVALNSARLVEIDTAANVPTAPRANRANRRRQALVTLGLPILRLFITN